MKIEGIACAPFFFPHSFFSLLVFFLLSFICVPLVWSIRMYFWCLYRRWGCFVLLPCSPAYFPKYKKHIRGLRNALFFCFEDFSLLYSVLFSFPWVCTEGICDVWIVNSNDADFPNLVHLYDDHSISKTSAP